MYAACAVNIRLRSRSEYVKRWDTLQKYLRNGGSNSFVYHGPYYNDDTDESDFIIRI